MMATFKRVEIGPVSYNTSGIIARLVEMSDGSLRVETWAGDRWQPGGTDVAMFLRARPVPPKRLAELGIPDSGTRTAWPRDRG
jgi:hypothetical protein